MRINFKKWMPTTKNQSIIFIYVFSWLDSLAQNPLNMCTQKCIKVPFWFLTFHKRWKFMRVKNINVINELLLSPQGQNSLYNSWIHFKTDLCSIKIYFDEINLFFRFVETSFLIHATAHQNKLNMWNKKLAMQIQTENQMNWFGKL